MKKKKTEQVVFRYWVETAVILLVIGLIFVNSQFFDGYDSSEISYDSGELVTNVNGYAVQDNSYQYMEDESGYIQIANGQIADQLLLSFGNQAQQDTDVSVSYMDNDGNVLEKVSLGTWKKGTAFAKIDIQLGEYSSYLIMIPADFQLLKVYYALENEISVTEKIFAVVIVILVVIVLTIALMALDSFRRIVEKIDGNVRKGFLNLKKKYPVIFKYFILFIGIAVIAVFFAYVLAQNNVYTFSAKTAVMAALCGFLLSIGIAFHKYFASRIEWVGFFIILIAGAMISFLEPPNVGLSWDDEIHFRNAVQISHILDQKISAADAAIINDYQFVALQRREYNREEQSNYTELLNELEKSHYYSEAGEYSAANTLITYIPSAVGLIIARGIGLPYSITLAVGRWMNVVLLAVLSFWSMKKLRTGKIVVLLIALIPTNLFIAANYTYDTWLTAWSMFGLSVFFGEWQSPEKKLTKWTPWLIVVPLFLAVMPKQVYFPLVFIALFMPSAKFISKQQKWKYRIFIIIAAVLPLILVYMSTIAGNAIGQGDVRGGDDVDATAQLEFLRSNPVDAFGAIASFLKGYLNPLVEGAEYTKRMGYYYTTEYFTVHGKILLATIILGALVSREEKEIKFPYWTKLGTIFVYAVIGFMAAFSMYIAFTAVGAETVNGCVGRYLLPAIFPVVYVCSRFSGKTYVKGFIGEENLNMVLLFILVCSSVAGFWTGCLALY
ncbi:MAG: DUF2142 domain-containing protein [Clostridiaceae bacterium]|nr:DUF2142 domain-containing protein [Clostridiaceae bacterium]